MYLGRGSGANIEGLISMCVRDEETGDGRGQTKGHIGGAPRWGIIHRCTGRWGTSLSGTEVK